MNTEKKYSIFLSHASEDARLASAVQELIEKTQAKRRGERLVFRSTDIKAIEGGADWYEAVIEALRSSRICLSLLTPTSIHKPWVLYESGAAYAIYRNKSKSLISLCASGITPSLVPSPFQRLQSRRLYDPDELEQLLRSLANTLQTRFKPSPQKINAVAELGKDLIGGWQSVQLARVAKRMELSPFRYEGALAVAKKHVFMAGQNLYYIASSKKRLDSITKFLNSGRGRKVDILLCDTYNAAGVKAWGQVNPAQPEIGWSYKDHLKTATQGFLGLISEVRKQKISGLNIRVLGLVPFSATVIDPSLESGVMAIQPVVNHGPTSGNRPQFLITNNQDDVFRYYWLNLQTAFESATDLEKAWARGTADGRSIVKRDREKNE